MRLRNNSRTPIYWRIFHPNDLFLIMGDFDGWLDPGLIVVQNHPSGRFKLEVKTPEHRFIAFAGPVYSNGIELQVDDAGTLRSGGGGPVAWTPPPPPPPSAPAIVPYASTLRVMAWNIREAKFSGYEGLPYHQSQEQLVSLIRRENPDIVLLNEACYSRWPIFSHVASIPLITGRNDVEDLRNLLHFPFWHYAETNMMGLGAVKLVGILSKYELGPQRRLHLTDGYAALRSAISLNGLWIQVFSHRCARMDPMGAKYAEEVVQNRQCMENAVRMINDIPRDQAIIFGGDLNVRPGHPNFTIFMQGSGCSTGDPLTGGPVDYIFTRGLHISRYSDKFPPGNPSDHGFISADIVAARKPYSSVYAGKIRLRNVGTGQILAASGERYNHLRSSGQQGLLARYGWDQNDFWRIKPRHDETNSNRLGIVFSGDVIRLEHTATRRNLHSHTGFPSPITYLQEATLFGASGAGDPNDDWRVEVVGSATWSSETPVRLVHVLSGAKLVSEPRAYRWGEEVCCSFYNDYTGGEDLWHMVEIRAA